MPWVRRIRPRSTRTYDTFTGYYLGRTAVGALACDNSLVDDGGVGGYEFARLPVNVAGEEALADEIIDGFFELGDGHIRFEGEVGDLNGALGLYGVEDPLLFFDLRELCGFGAALHHEPHSESGYKEGYQHRETHCQRRASALQLAGPVPTLAETQMPAMAIIATAKARSISPTSLPEPTMHVLQLNCVGVPSRLYIRLPA